MTGNLNERFEFDAILIDEHSSECQYRQLEQQIRDAIAGRLLAAGARIPSSRNLAKTLGVSRNTVLTAYEQLISEGYLESIGGSGTRVAAIPPEAFEFRGNTKRPISSFHSPTPEDLSTLGRQLSQETSFIAAGSDKPLPFRPHLPALDQFPSDVWNRLSNEQTRFTSRHLNQCDPQGYYPLRESIAQYMGLSRGLSCTADQVVITAGAQQGFALVSQLLLDPRDTVWVEEPGNAPANRLLELANMKILPVPLDSEGMDVSGIRPNTSTKPKLICVTPGGQWPMAMTMSLNRRLELLTVAQRHNCWVLEDDYNGEFRYTGRPHASLCSLDRSGRTVYMGTFSKMLFPAIRLAFLIVPPSLSPTFAYARWLQDRFSSPLPQMVLHRFIESGNFVKHIRKMRTLYADRQNLIHQALHKHFKDHIKVDLPESGLHLVAKGKTQKIEDQLIAAANRAGIEYHLVKTYSRNPKSARGLILGFAAFDQQSTQKAIRRWAREFEN